MEALIDWLNRKNPLRHHSSFRPGWQNAPHPSRLLLPNGQRANMPGFIIARLAVAAALLAGNLLACAPARAEAAMIVITQAVRDFAAWEKAFDADKPGRDKGQIAER